jgi:hypothetical protein
MGERHCRARRCGWLLRGRRGRLGRCLPGPGCRRNGRRWRAGRGAPVRACMAVCRRRTCRGCGRGRTRGLRGRRLRTRSLSRAGGRSRWRRCGRGCLRAGPAIGPPLPGLLGRERFLEPANNRRLNRGGRRPYELAHFLELDHHGLALYAELLREFVYPNLRHCAPSTRPGLTGPVSRSGQRVLRSGVSLCCSSPHAHRSLIAISACFPRQYRPALAARRCRHAFWPAAGGRALPNWPRYSASGPVPTGPGRRRARANALRRCALSKHSWLGCRYAPRPGPRPRTSGTTSSPAATRRSKSDFSARPPHPTHVRTGVCRADCGYQEAIFTLSLHCPRIGGIGHRVPRAWPITGRPGQRPVLVRGRMP